MSAMFTPTANAFRIYDDNAGEAASSPLEAQDVDHSFNVDSNNSLQIRWRVDEVGGVSGTTMDDYIVQYSKNSGGFVNLTTSDIGDGIRAVAAGLTNDNATTDRSSDPISNPGGGSFVAGEQSTDGSVDDMQLTASNFTEHVYGVEFVAANVAADDTFDFKFSKPSGIVNSVTPRITISKSGGAQTISGTVGEISTSESLPADAVLANAAAQSISGTVGEIATGFASPVDHALSIVAASQPITGTVGEISSAESVPSQTIANAAAQVISGTVGEISTAESVPADPVLVLSTPQVITGAGAIATGEAVPSLRISIPGSGVGPVRLHARMTPRRVGFGM